MMVVVENAPMTCSSGWLAPIALASVLVACGRSSVDADSPQVAVRVNGSAITTPQIQAALTQESGSVPAASSNNSAILEQLIEEQLLVEKARQANIDQEPDVMMAMEAAKRTVLANEWLKRAAADVLPPTDRDIDDYLLQHSELNSGRHRFSFRLAVPDAPVTELPKLKELLARTKDLDEALNQLRDSNVQYVLSQISMGSEQLPTELIANLIGLKNGERAAFAYRGGVGLVEMQSATTEVIDDAQRRRIVESTLILQRKNERAEATLNGLKANAKIELYGDFQGYAAELLTAPVAPPAAEDTAKPPGKTLN